METRAHLLHTPGFSLYFTVFVGSIGRNCQQHAQLVNVVFLLCHYREVLWDSDPGKSQGDLFLVTFFFYLYCKVDHQGYFRIQLIYVPLV